MKTVKDVSEITGVSIRTLRYYDEIGLLKPTELTEAGYRLYDTKALEKLQEIMFFRELEIPLADIKEIMEHPDYDKEQVLLAQKSLLEQKRNRLKVCCHFSAEWTGDSIRCWWPRRCWRRWRGSACC